jgi:hypothetical protein
MAQLLVTSRELTTGSVTFNKLKFDEITGKAREALCFIDFRSANVATAAPHALRRIPVGATVIAKGRNGGAPGNIYVDDFPLPFDKYNVVLKCDTAQTWAVLALR